MEENYTDNNPFGDTVEIYDVETEKELISKQEDEDNKNNK